IEAFDRRDPLAWPSFATEDDVRGMLRYGFLVQEQDGMRFAGWLDDPAVRDLMARRGRASTGSQTAAERQPDVQQPAGDRQTTGRLPAGGGQPASVQNMTEQNMTERDMAEVSPIRERGVDTPPPPANQSSYEGLLPLAYTEAAGLVLAAWPPEKRCAPRGVVMAIRQDSGHPDGHTCRKIAEAARVWVAAYEAQGRVQYLPRLDNWISSGAWREAPPADAPAAAGPARRPRTKSGDPAVTAAELGAIIEHAKAAGL
ncbi:MAG: hypothetical protein ACO248_00875, partial [Burkholderiaceae bacterium]